MPSICTNSDYHKACRAGEGVAIELRRPQAENQAARKECREVNASPRGLIIASNSNNSSYIYWEADDVLVPNPGRSGEYFCKNPDLHTAPESSII